MQEALSYLPATFFADYQPSPNVVKQHALQNSMPFYSYQGPMYTFFEPKEVHYDTVCSWYTHHYKVRRPNPWLQDAHGNTLIHHLVGMSYHENYLGNSTQLLSSIIKDALGANSDTQQLLLTKNSDGQTPLHCVIKKRNYALVPLVITAAAINVRDRKGKTPLRTLFGCTVYYDALQRKIAKKPLEYNLTNMRYMNRFDSMCATMQLLCQLGADTNIADEHNITPLLYLAKRYVSRWHDAKNYYAQYRTLAQLLTNHGARNVMCDTTDASVYDYTIAALKNKLFE